MNQKRKQDHVISVKKRVTFKVFLAVGEEHHYVFVAFCHESTRMATETWFDLVSKFGYAATKIFLA